jgi:hypothetical protein
MRKLLTFLIALAAVVGVTASSFGGSMAAGGGEACGGGVAAPSIRQPAFGSQRFKPLAGQLASVNRPMLILLSQA